MANTAAQGGGVAVVGGTAVALSRIVVEGNSASTRAGGLLVRGNTVVVSAGNDTLVVENRVTDTTACGGGVAVDMGAVLLHDGSVAVTNNTATSGTASGGGLCIDAAVVRAPAGAPSHWRLRVHGNEGVRGGGVAMAGVATLEQASGHRSHQQPAVGNGRPGVAVCSWDIGRIKGSPHFGGACRSC